MAVQKTLAGHTYIANGNILFVYKNSQIIGKLEISAKSCQTVLFLLESFFIIFTTWHQGQKQGSVKVGWKVGHFLSDIMSQSYKINLVLRKSN